MKTINPSNHNGETILVRDAEGLCALSTMQTMYDTAELDSSGLVFGWDEEFDGQRDWYRLPDAAWTFCLADHGTLMDYETGTEIRPATEDEAVESREAAGLDGGAGVIRVDGRRVYVRD